MTECSETLFLFEAHFSRPVVAEFSGVRMTTEGGSAAADDPCALAAPGKCS
jgi:hypothetical protein